MNKILQLSLVSALVATNAFSTENADFSGGLVINGTNELVSGTTAQAGDSNGITNDVYQASASTAIDVMPGTNKDTDKGLIGDGTVTEGLVVRHHNVGWIAETEIPNNFYIATNDSGFIANSINIGQEDDENSTALLQEMFHTNNINNTNNIYTTIEGDDRTFFLSDGIPKVATLGTDAKGLSENNCVYPHAVKDGNVLIVPESNFIIPSPYNNTNEAINGEISAILSNQKSKAPFNGTGFTASQELQLLPATGKMLSLTGANQFEGKIIIGNGSEGNSGTVAFGESNGTNTMDALGTYTEMVVNDNATVRLAGDDPVSINKKWTFHGAAKLTASQRVTIASGAKMIFGAN